MACDHVQPAFNLWPFRSPVIQKTQTDAVGRAVAWLMLGVAGGLFLDLAAKEILQSYSLQQFVLVRSLIAITLLLIIAPRFGGIRSLRTREKAWHLLRTILAVGAMFGFFYGLSKMPLVNALTLGYTAPLMVTALSAVFLGDHVGWRRWTAVVVGFFGVLIMLRPGSGELSFPAIAVLIAAFCYACQAITARKLGVTESTLALSFYVVVGPLIVAAGALDADSWVQPDTRGWILFTFAGLCSVVAWIGLVNGYRGAPPALLAPLEYTALVGGAIAGYLIWDEVPDRGVVVGALIIVASGLFVVYRDLGSRTSQ